MLTDMQCKTGCKTGIRHRTVPCLCGVEYEEKITKPDGTATSNYVNVSVNGWSLLCLYALTKGIVLPFTTPYTNNYSYIPAYG